jgi:hypothetical protein
LERADHASMARLVVEKKGFRSACDGKRSPAQIPHTTSPRSTACGSTARAIPQLLLLRARDGCRASSSFPSLRAASCSSIVIDTMLGFPASPTILTLKAARPPAMAYSTLERIQYGYPFSFISRFLASAHFSTLIPPPRAGSCPAAPPCACTHRRQSSLLTHPVASCESRAGRRIRKPPFY